MPQSDVSGSTDLESKIHQNSNLSGVTVETSEKKIELKGTVNSAADRDEAVRIAKDSANGKKVKNHIKVSANAGSNSNGASSNPR
ncbi:MAG TPA: BON domain-containing protein [Terriglobales bacterium]|jgi:osmotically-inducible protein OsmY|nr:BON domain-containing protein [Terriglobales bacterium]